MCANLNFPCEYQVYREEDAFTPCGAQPTRHVTFTATLSMSLCAEHEREMTDAGAVLVRALTKDGGTEK